MTEQADYPAAPGNKLGNDQLGSAADAEDRALQRINDRLLAISKAGITAVTVLNTGSWLALLSQAGALSSATRKIDIAPSLLAWGLGAFFGTSIWLSMYLNEHALGAVEFDRSSRWKRFAASATLLLGIVLAIAAGASFLFGAWSLADAFRPGS